MRTIAKNGWYKTILKDSEGHNREYNVLYQNGRIRRKILVQNPIPEKRDWRFYNAKTYEFEEKANKHENLMKKNRKEMMRNLSKANRLKREAGVIDPEN